MPKTHSTLTAAFITLTLAGCGGHTRTESGVNPDEYVSVRVENDRFEDLRIYLRVGSREGQRIRLGTANGKQASLFKIPKTAVFGATTVVFELSPIGGGGNSFSEQITVNPGEEIVLRIPPV